MDLSLVILAAGIGSRFGGLKQITPLTGSGVSIIDFSVFDAIRSGFSKVIIVLRKEIRDDFRNFFGKRLERNIKVEYVNQTTEIEGLPNRKKPLGTAHAVLAAREMIDGPFSVINADDFYGLEAFQKAVHFMQSKPAYDEHAVIGYKLSSTLSEFGAVSRAVCTVDKNNYLTGIKELHQVFSEAGKIYSQHDSKKHIVNPDSLVSMNFWCFQPQIIDQFKKRLREFMDKLPANPGSEFLIPDVANEMVRSGQGLFRVIPTNSSWFGITYKEDFEYVSNNINKLTKSGAYPDPLWK